MPMFFDEAVYYSGQPEMEHNGSHKNLQEKNVHKTLMEIYEAFEGM